MFRPIFVTGPVDSIEFGSIVMQPTTQGRRRGKGEGEERERERRKEKGMRMGGTCLCVHEC
jgi:hypothetical protein